jgi:toxin FitB
VTRYLLDTNIISEASKPRPSIAIANWVRSQADDHLFIAALTVAEIWRGVLKVASPRRRRDLEAWFASAEGPPALFSGRVLSFDARAAMEWGD